MNLSPNQWHVKFYFWCLDVWDAFLDTYTDRSKSNLCHYIRTIFVWMPFSIACQIGLLVYAGYVLIWYPVTRFSWIWYGRGILAIAVIIGLVFAYRFVIEWWEEHQQRAMFRGRSPQVQPTHHSSEPVEETKEGGPGLLEMIFLWLVAQKQKICPIISFTNSDHKVKEVA